MRENLSPLERELIALLMEARRCIPVPTATVSMPARVKEKAYLEGLRGRIDEIVFKYHPELLDELEGDRPPRKGYHRTQVFND